MKSTTEFHLKEHTCIYSTKLLYYNLTPQQQKNKKIYVFLSHMSKFIVYLPSDFRWTGFYSGLNPPNIVFLYM